jgi:hypothetical protein
MARGEGGYTGRQPSRNNFLLPGVWQMQEVYGKSLQNEWSGSELYPFSTTTFRPNIDGRLGPDLSQARDGVTGTGVDLWKFTISYFDVLDGLQFWTVPVDGTYRITAKGAGHGSNSNNPAQMRGDFTLARGQILKIVCGQRAASSNTLGGGSGGTFVYTGDIGGPGLLLAAGGVGAGTSSCNSSPGGALRASANTSTAGKNGGGNTGVAGGSNGNPGLSNSTKGGGAGWLGDAGGTYGGQRWDGGITGSNAGGYGGGGGSDGSCGGECAGGGGGGYSGGGAGGCSSGGDVGGGGGSFNGGAFQLNELVTDRGSGFVIVNLLN